MGNDAMNRGDFESLWSQIAYESIVTVSQDIKTLEHLGLLHKNIEKRPYIIAHYDKNDAGNRNYIKGQQDLAKTLGIPYSRLNSNLLADGDDVLETIKNQNRIELIGSIFVANPIHPDLDFQKTIDTVDPIKEIDWLSTFHKSKYIWELSESLEWVYIHPTALSVLTLVQATLGKDLTNRQILVAWWSGKVWSMICAVLKLAWANPIIYNTDPSTYQPEELESKLEHVDGFVCVIRGAEFFDGKLFDKFKWPIIDVSTAKNANNQTVWWIQTASFDPKADHIYIPPTKGGVGTGTKVHLMGNYIKSITAQMVQNGKDPRYFRDLVHQLDNSDIFEPTHTA